MLKWMKDIYTKMLFFAADLFLGFGAQLMREGVILKGLNPDEHPIERMQKAFSFHFDEEMHDPSISEYGINLRKQIENTTSRFKSSGKKLQITTRDRLESVMSNVGNNVYSKDDALKILDEYMKEKNPEYKKDLDINNKDIAMGLINKDGLFDKEAIKAFGKKLREDLKTTEMSDSEREKIEAQLDEGEALLNMDTLSNKASKDTIEYEDKKVFELLDNEKPLKQKKTKSKTKKKTKKATSKSKRK